MRRSLFFFSSLCFSIQVEIPVPDDVTKRKTTLELDPAGDRMHLSFKNRPDFEPLEGKFKDLISPLDSVWMLGERAYSQNSRHSSRRTFLFFLRAYAMAALWQVSSRPCWCGRLR